MGASVSIRLLAAARVVLPTTDSPIEKKGEKTFANELCLPETRGR